MLNKRQKTIIVIAVFCIVAMVLYPPWMIDTGVIKARKITAGSYAFIWAAHPKIPTRHEYESGESLAYIDLYRLSVQFVAVLVITIGLCLVCGTTKRDKD